MAEPVFRYGNQGVNVPLAPEEIEAAEAEEEAPELREIKRLVGLEIDRQKWRGEMASRAYEFNKNAKSEAVTDSSAAEQGIGKALPPIERDGAFKAGGWIASAAQQRRRSGLDGGHAVSKIRIRKSGD